MTTTCPCCGHASTAHGCGHCQGAARSLDGSYTVRPGRGLALGDVFAGLRDVSRAVFWLLHEREFIGRLRLPVAANAVAFALLLAFGGSVLLPLYAAVFRGPWPLADGWRAAVADTAPHWWLLVSWLLLGPPLLELLAGAAQEPLRSATELRMLGPPRQPPPAHGVLRLRDRVRLLAAALVALPAALLLVLVPWLGPPLLLLLGGAVAAVVWFEPPMAPRGLSLPSRLAVLWRNRWRALGVGLGLQFAAVVPFVNLLALAPIATLACTTNYLHFAKDPRPPT